MSYLVCEKRKGGLKTSPPARGGLHTPPFFKRAGSIGAGHFFIPYPPIHTGGYSGDRGLPSQISVIFSPK